MSELSETARAAEWYGRHGIPIFPVHVAINGKCSCGKQCASPGKHPRTEHGHQDATTDPEQIRAWWSRWPEANIGMPTGEPSGRLAVDIDPRHGGDATFEALILKHGRHAGTAEAVTGGGGRHVIFRHPAGTRSGTLGPGIDLKAAGGYILIAPSLHPSGKRYVWDGIEGGKALLHPADPPAWLLPQNGNGSGPAAPVPEKIPHGSQHRALVSFAGTMRNRGAGFDEIFAALMEMNTRRCEQPGPEANIRQIAESVCRYPAGKIYIGPDEAPAKPGGEQAEPKKGRARPRVLGLQEVREMEATAAPEMMIENIIPWPGCTLMFGREKAGKTLLAAQAAFCVAGGLSLFDYYRTLRPGGVLFVEADDPAGAASIKLLLEKTDLELRSDAPFYVVADQNLRLGESFTAWLRSEITARKLSLIVLDSYTALRGIRGAGGDVVKMEAADMGALDRLGKEMGVTILLIHHESKGGAGLDWSARAAGSFAIAAAVEAMVSVSRFPELESNSPERLVRVRGRHLADHEMLLRFRSEHLNYSHVLDGPAAGFFPQLREIEQAFGKNSFTPKDLLMETGTPRASAHRLLCRLAAAGAVRKCGFGEYRLEIQL